MQAYRWQSSTAQFHNDPKIGRLILVSLVLHLLFVLIMSGALFLSPKREQPPVYYVDLVHKPVLNPQAGRPEPRPKAKPAPAPVKPVAVPPPKPIEPPKPVEPPKPIVKPTPKPTVKIAKPKPAEPPKPTVKVAKPTPKPVVKAQPKPEPRTEQKLQSALEAMREKQARQTEIETLKQKLAGLQAAATVPADVPIGMPTGTGDEIGVSNLAYIKAFIQENWMLSPYLLDQSRLASIEAKVLLQYSADGTLVRYRIVEGSGNSQFDDSITRAIIKSKQLAQKLPRNEELTVVFNLKEMAAARR